MTLTFGSLFAGIGGMDLGLQRAGLTCRWQVEIDPWCRRVLTKHWPDVPKYGDIREVSGEGLERVDLICGGFPCQDISNAGKRAGIDGERSGLWSEYIRLVRVLRPRYVLVENVAALLGRGVDRVLGDLAASGYDCEWDCLPAAAVGAPHIRDRLFIVAQHRPAAVVARPGGDGLLANAASGGQRADQDDAHRPAQLEGVANTERAGTTMAFPERQGLALGEGATGQRTHAPIARSGWWEVEPPVGRVADGIPGRVDRLRGLGNAVVPQVAQFIGERIIACATT